MFFEVEKDLRVQSTCVWKRIRFITTHIFLVQGNSQLEQKHLKLPCWCITTNVPTYQLLDQLLCIPLSYYLMTWMNELAVFYSNMVVEIHYILARCMFLLKLHWINYIYFTFYTHIGLYQQISKGNVCTLALAVICSQLAMMEMFEGLHKFNKMCFKRAHVLLWLEQIT